MTSTDSPIQRSIPCARCGYVLRGLAVDASCPECSLPIGRTLSGDWLSNTDAVWRRRVAIALLAATAFSLPILLLELPFNLRGWLQRLTGLGVLPVTLPFIAGALASGCVLIATRREPGRARVARRDRSRRLARAGAVVMLALDVFGFVTVYGLLRLPMTPLWPQAVLWVVLTLVQMLTVLAVLFWLRDLARRSRRPRRVGLIRVLIAALPVAALVIVSCQAVYLVDYLPMMPTGGGGQGPSPAARLRMQLCVAVWSYLQLGVRIAVFVAYVGVGHAVLVSVPPPEHGADGEAADVTPTGSSTNA